ncbi:PLP-dependent aminotransferase family protein [Photobacterium sanctipauli]|uniref:PLP-dependent aminotransferase family protein n=1 Tax=Photobacterium sanctipauli TaxID=1342794 RepID=A0A2T3NN07_9GAMM|nr:PLP-dependent aminotransferase family protein [Photobacterium sanctipauli]PSW16869.1 PLP-dependent aminotransferase family protein [Photobacterium sanctipauli]
MQMIEVGDLTLSPGKGSRQSKLFHAIRSKIVSGLWSNGGKLPSTRKLAQELSLSRNTVIAAYEQLAAEGYIESRLGSGFYVAVELPEQYIDANITPTGKVPQTPHLNVNAPFAPGVPDLAQFPHAKWQRLLQCHSSLTSLLGSQDIQGSKELRIRLADYLASSRSVVCNSNRIIITSGAQQALSIAVMATLKQSDSILMEQPGYTQMDKIIALLGLDKQGVRVHEKQGVDIDAILQSRSQAVYITPSNQYPMGTAITTEKRLKLIEWAMAGNRWIIEDDYDSEFQFAHRPYTSLQGLAGQMGMDGQVLYIGSFSKVMFNSLRIGYLVVPEHLVEPCLMIKDALSGDTPGHTQAALADFILEGDLLRHIRKMRRLYQDKYQQIVRSIEYYLGQHVEVISQPAGLHVTLKWQQGIDEQTWVSRAKEAGIIMRPLAYYEHLHNENVRSWHSVVLGYGNVALGDIDSLISSLAMLFHAKKK